MEGGGLRVDSPEASARAKHLKTLFDDKVLDLFIRECESLMQQGINLKELSMVHHLEDDM
jgi:hypothetical protein